MVKINFTRLLILFVLITINTLKTSAQECVWAKSAGGNSNTIVESSATDASGNTYVAGYYQSDTTYFDNIFILNTDSISTNIFVAKYDASGNPLWVKNFGGIYYDDVNSIAADKFGNVYISGTLGSPFVTFGSFTLSNPNYKGEFLVKLNSEGTVKWATSKDGLYYEYAQTCVTTDASGNVFFAGAYNNDSVTFGNTTLTDSSQLGDNVFLAKYDSLGNVLWALGFPGPGANPPTGICTDGDGNVYVTGGNTSSMRFGAIELYNPVGYTSVFIVKCSATGNVVWAKGFGGNDITESASLAADASGNIYLAGAYDCDTLTIGTTMLINAGPGSSSPDIFLAKYNTAGNMLWAQSTGGSGQDWPSSIIASNSGNIFMTGYFFSPSINFGSTTLTNLGLFLAGYNSSGNAVWGKSASGFNASLGMSIGKDALDNLYVAGSYGATFSLDANTLTNNNTPYSDLFLAKFDNIPSGIQTIVNTKQSLSLYPNPAMNKIDINSNEKIRRLTISNSSGSLIYSSLCNDNNISVDISKLPSGVYFANINGILAKEFVKE